MDRGKAVSCKGSAEGCSCKAAGHAKNHHCRICRRRRCGGVQLQSGGPCQESSLQDLQKKA